MEGGKSGLVCSALRDAMLAVDAELYLKPVLISYASQGQLEVALALLKDAKEARMAREASHSQASTSSGKAPAMHHVGYTCSGEYGNWVDIYCG